jgi:O-antigen/teichoic acid export membrane protein
MNIADLWRSDVHSQKHAGRSKERTLLRNSIQLALARSCSLIVSLILVHFLVKSLLPVTYGAWTVIVSSIALLSFLDLGVGQSLVNPLTQAIRDEDRSQIRSLITTNIAVLFGSSTFILLIVVISVFLLPWQSFLSLGSQSSSLLTRMALLQGAIFALSFALSSATYIRLAQHRSGRSGVAVMIGSLVAACGTLIAIAVHSDILIITSLASLGPLLGSVITTLDLFATENLFRPALRFLKLSVARLSIQQGWLFGLQTLSGIAAFTVDTIVIGNALGPTSVTQYNVTSRVPLAGLSLILAAIIPVWPFIYDHTADGRGLRSIVPKIVALFLLPSVALAVAFGFGANTVVHFLGSGHVQLDTSLIWALSAWVIVAPVGAVLGYSLVAVGRLRLQAMIAVSMAVLNLVLSVILVRVVGVSGVMWATVISYSVVEIPTAIVGLYRRDGR